MNPRLSALRLPLLTFALALTASTTASASVWFVDQNAAGTANGTSWTNAFVTVQAGIAAAGNGDEIWVAQATYIPPNNGGYVITASIKLYGGFQSGDASVAARSGVIMNTILEGNNNTPLNTADDVLHVVSVVGVAGTGGNPGVIIDGFRIQHGLATGAGVFGGGIFSDKSDLNVANCFVWSNTAATANSDLGGGIYFTSATPGAPPTYPGTAFTLNIKNSDFRDNQAFDGAAVYCDDARGLVVNSSFLTNMADQHGAGMFLSHMGTNDSLDITNCQFYANGATNGGTANQGAGVCLLSGGVSKIVNCTFASNYANGSTVGQALRVDGTSQATVSNSILFFNNYSGSTNPPISGSPTVTYSDIEGSFTGAGNILGNPMFINLGLGRLGLASNSPCLDAADYSKVLADILDVNGDGNTTQILPIDLGGATRLVDQPSVTDTGVGSAACSSCTYLDMGCFERP